MPSLLIFGNTYQKQVQIMSEVWVHNLCFQSIIDSFLVLCYKMFVNKSERAGSSPENK